MPDIDEKIIIKKINPNDETVILLKNFFEIIIRKIFLSEFLSFFYNPNYLHPALYQI